jgi:HSP20 family protein
MLIRSDPFRGFDRLTDQLWGSLRPTPMPMDAYRHGDEFIVHIDLPGVDTASVDLTVEQNVLTVSAERTWQPDEQVQVIASERPQGRFSRQLFLGEGLDIDRVEAAYDAGVLTIRLPVAEQAKPRKVEIGAGNGSREISTTAS